MIGKLSECKVYNLSQAYEEYLQNIGAFLSITVA